MPDKLLKCPKCSSDNVVVQIASETKSEKIKHGFFLGILIGLINLVLWIFLFVPRLLIALFVPKKQRIVTTHKSMAVCQNCGNTFDPQESILIRDKANSKTKLSIFGERWYTKTSGIILMLFLFFPIGLYLMWKYGKNWETWIKVTISVFFVLVFIGGFNR